MLAAVIPAAGASSRMRGADKLIQDVGGISALRHTVEAAMEVADCVAVALPPQPEHPRWDALTGLDIQRVAVQRPEMGLGPSLSAAIKALPPDIQAVLIALPDMPDIGTQEMAAIASRFDRKAPDQIVQATTGNGLPGHPTLFGRAHRSALEALSGDRGAYKVLQEYGAQVQLVPLPGQRARRDLDTPEDWAAWRKDHP